MASVSVVALSGPAATATAGIITDGRFDPNEGYQLGYSITLNTESGPITGGQLWFGRDDTANYLYVLLPKDFVDNSYGVNAIGWPGNKGHSFEDLLKSDSLGSSGKKGSAIELSLSSGDATFVVDYLARDQTTTTVNKKTVTTITGYRSGGIATGPDADLAENEGAVISGDVSAILEIATSLEWNILRFASPDDIANSTGVIQNSPAADANYQNVEAGFEDWLFEVGYEFKFSLSAFGEEWIDPTQALTLITLGQSHASPSKAKFEGYEDPVCIAGCSTTTTTDVPEPTGALLAASGIAGLGWFTRRRRKRRS